jgi:hypothetical protein
LLASMARFSSMAALMPRVLRGSPAVDAPQVRRWARFVLTMVSPNHRIINLVC